MKTRFSWFSSAHRVIDDDPTAQARPSRRRVWLWLSIGLIGVGLSLAGISVGLDIQRTLKSPAPFGVTEAQQGLMAQPALSVGAIRLSSTSPEATSTETIRAGEGSNEPVAQAIIPEAGDSAVVEGLLSAISISPTSTESPTVASELATGAMVPVDGVTEVVIPNLLTITPTEIVPSVTPTVLTIGSESTATPVPPAPTPEASEEPQPPTRIVAPSIGLDTKVIPVDYILQEENGILYKTWQVADYAASWNSDSKSPGQGGNIVITGHNNIRGEVFRNVPNLGVGDRIILYSGDRAYTYVVESRLLLLEKGASDQQRAENARWIGEFSDERLTLVTCWPYTGDSHRVIVIAKPAS